MKVNEPVMTPPSEAAMRNRAPIAEVLERVLPRREGALLLDVASGGGEHAVYFAERFSWLTVQPSDRNARALADIDARAEGASRVRRAIALDVLDAPWPIARADAVTCINMLHASAPETLAALMSGAAAVLAPGDPLVTYGPYRIGGRHTAPSNETFDAWLKRERDPRWGIRDLEDVERQAARAGLALEQRIAMPANNFVLVFRRSA
ncbi:MAG TPA: DUF938 domain-containing protein [Polyangiaceae bacterium]|jgi:cyclopropane fatty-acyl-phospholipid synthase-like methyltransferase